MNRKTFVEKKLRIICAEGVPDKRPEKIPVSLEKAYLCGGLSLCGICSGYGNLTGIHTYLGCPHGKIGQKLIIHKHIPEGTHSFVFEVPCGISSVCARSIGEMMTGRKRYNGGVYQP